MGGTQTNTQDFLSAEQRRNINYGLDDVYRAYHRGQGDFHGLAPDQLSGMTQGAISQMGAYGMANPFMPGAQQYIGDALGQGRPDLMGAEAGANQAIGGLAPGMQSLQQFASGQFTNPTQNPVYQAMSRDMVRDFDENTLPGIDAAFSAAGRSPSGLQALAHGRAAEGLSEAQAQLAGQIYNQERQRQLGAAGQLQQGGLAGIGAMGNLYGQVTGDMRGAASMIPGMYGMGLQGYQAALGAGGLLDAQNERVRQYGIDQFNATNPYARAGRLMGLSQGQYNQTSEQQYEPGTMDMLGLGIGGASTLLGLFGLGG